MKKHIAIIMCLACISGCVRYGPAIERQLEKEHAAISAQVESCHE